MTNDELDRAVAEKLGKRLGEVSIYGPISDGTLRLQDGRSAIYDTVFSPTKDIAQAMALFELMPKPRSLTCDEWDIWCHCAGDRVGWAAAGDTIPIAIVECFLGWTR